MNILNLNIQTNLKRPYTKPGEGRGSISYEVAHEYFGDYILWFNKKERSLIMPKQNLEKHSCCCRRPNCRNTRKVPGLFFYSDVTSLTAQLDYMVDAINSLAK